MMFITLIHLKSFQQKRGQYDGGLNPVVGGYKPIYVVKPSI